MPEWMQALTVGEITAVVGALVFVVGVFRKAYPFVRRVIHFLDDLMGEPARPGSPGRAGVLERLEAHEAAIAVIRHEVLPNHGGSLKDAVTRIEAQQREDVTTRSLIKETTDSTAFILNSHVREAIRVEERLEASIITNGPARMAQLESLVRSKLGE